mmetsp:Transcript_8837/g.14802  ORF Transcript_8837/g.14802 Transcript_8837/m.14802 type:complete len:558 (+) Transcript_8837:215-1888(+)|eukprot:CAMPEP_0119318578 /NCGR_PEP_ID=MMETSP1333-20130426/46821_1 /TAXON_ID=418940 /ORGANISM="Scyphosphaera apsteinii, Strain RCC1455" /LENGTH=557 /DNA_ID=CAMNT_0007324791 /DNA_START=214 /DNA_END=1887 /DNA_ORIENTATION=-
MAGSLLGFALWLGIGHPAAGFENMNGEYVITKTPNAGGTKYNTKWSEYTNELGGVDYFEMYIGPFTSLYSQVWWAALPPVELPDVIKKRFNDSAMAIIGYEVDQVRKKGEKDVDGSILTHDVSVPINVAYNHHHDAFFTGKHSHMEKVPYDPNDRSISQMARADPHFVLVPVEISPSLRGLPTSAHLAAGNGGEYRKSYHGFASSTAYVIDSPQSLTVVAMQIDTWNRDKMNLTGSKFVPGPQPKQSGARPQHGEEIPYSGLLECPLTTRVTKHIEDASAPFGGKSGSHQYYDPNPPPSNCEYQPCGGMTVGVRNMTIPWSNECYPEPRESILSERNPTCDLEAYSGGLRVCKHMWSLLDAEQQIPWQDKPLRYYQKYRFYYQPYDPRVHLVSEPRVSWGIGAGDGSHSEYDVPQCAEGTPAEKCTHVVWGVLTPGGKDLHLAAIHMHCHAPTCIAMELWNNRTGELLCRQTPIYGGTGDKTVGDKFNEPGYILTPPCLWGAERALEPMPLASGVKFMVKAITNSTYLHHGEMAFPEVTLVPWSASAPHQNAFRREQ